MIRAGSFRSLIDLETVFLVERRLVFSDNEVTCLELTMVKTIRKIG